MIYSILNALKSKVYSSSEKIHGNYSAGRQDRDNVWWKDNN